MTADQLCTPDDLEDALQQDLDTATATLWVECATAAVQAAARQRIVLVEDDEVDLTGLASSWLDLPEFPVVDITSVVLDGTTLTAGVAGSGGLTYRQRGIGRLWRGDGWQTYCGEPSDVGVVYSHGYASGDQRLQLARSATIAIAKIAYTNPGGVASEKIDDYAVAFAAAEAAMDSTPGMRAALRQQYGRRGGFVQIGN